MAKHPVKQVFNKQYFHTDTLRMLPPAQYEQVIGAAQLAKLEPGNNFNVVRLEDRSAKVGLLNYRDFFDSPFPQLEERWIADLNARQVSYRTYKESLNPPILHRKELLIARDHPRWQEFATLTESAEQIGLFDQPSRIGYRAQWTHLIRERGYVLTGHQFVPLGNGQGDDNSDDNDSSQSFIERHRTALVRYGLSAPIQSLARNGYLDGKFSVFDYGCGRGDDLRGLVKIGIDAAGWDPHFAAEEKILEADIVNLGFVINVIEDFDERIEALTRAYSLARQLLVVSVMLANDGSTKGMAMNDGVLTARRTFQKYYTQAEIREFIETILDNDPIPAAPGVLYVFRDKDAEQRYLGNRYKSRRRPTGLHSGRSTRKLHSLRAELVEAKYAEYKLPLENLWNTCLTLGRKPSPMETCALTDLIEGFGSLESAYRFIAKRKDDEELKRARDRRIIDITVYLALQLFDGDRAYKHLEPELKQDIRAFFGTLKAAKEAARALLFQIADTELIEHECRRASDLGLGLYEVGESLQLHTSLVGQLPPLLRVYVGCASTLYGDYNNADLVKIHIGSGKLTLMRFDDFDGAPLPRMVERVKLKLRKLDIEYFDYEEGMFDPPFLYGKSRFINEEYYRYPDQALFDQQLNNLSFLELEGHGPEPEVLARQLELHRFYVDDFELKRVQSVPELDSPCGRYFTFRQLIRCGETQSKAGIPNTPRNVDSYSALLDLATNILDPVIDYFGMIKLTYGFCSIELEKAIPGRNAPRLDQHAAHEKRPNGRFICDRLGAAVDFIVVDEDMEEVANWIAEETPFDRLYFYGKSSPIHLSYGPQQSRAFIEIRESGEGRRIPKVRTLRT